MKIEYLKDSPDGKVLRLFDFSSNEAMEFKNLLDDLVNAKIQALPLHEHCLINPGDNCHLFLKMGLENKGIAYDADGMYFECVLNKEGYENMIEMVASFALHPVEFKGYEWLDETSDIALLMTAEKQWASSK